MPNGTWVGSLTEFEPKKGYWFISNADFDFAYNQPNSFSRTQSVSINNNVPDGFGYSQSIRQAFYFIKEVEEIELGDWIIAYNEDVVAGAREWVGEYTDIPAMGYDGNINRVGYCDIAEAASTPSWCSLPKGTLMGGH